jgi:phage gpG-like protein
MAKFKVDVDETDLGEVKANLTLQVEGTAAAVEKVIARFALKIARDAKRNAPVDTGRLRASIQPVLEKLAARVVAGGEITGANVDYAAAQEFGSKSQGIKAKKYMTKAWKKHKDDFERRIKEVTGLFGTL